MNNFRKKSDNKVVHWCDIIVDDQLAGIFSSRYQQFVRSVTSNTFLQLYVVNLVNKYDNAH